MTAAQDALKRAAAARAVEEVSDGMVIGLGSGSTAEFAVEALAARVAQGLRVAGIPTSERTGALAQRLGIELTDFSRHPRLDLVIDGADEVERATLHLVKGRGGALLREKIVAAASGRMIVIVDESKLVDRLGAHMPVPVEIVAFGWETTMARLVALGANPVLRKNGDQVFVTDGGNYIADCAFGGIADPAATERLLAAQIGVVDSGLFIGIASQIVVAAEAGVTILRK